MNRRSFIEYSSKAGLLTMFQAHSQIPFQSKIKSNTHLIKSLELLTQVSLSVMKTFYVDLIGFPLLFLSNTSLSIKCGSSTLTFVKSPDVASRPFYHFAFNIPENKIEAAFDWQRKKTPIIHPNPTGPIDEITHFSHWNAHSVFFLDPAGNLVEYIARHTLDNERKGPFTLDDILYASEIGFIVEDVLATGKMLLDQLPLKEYKSITNNFWPIGDETGLLLFIEKGKEWRANPGERNVTDLFKTKVGIEPTLNLPWNITDFPYEIFHAP